MQVTLQISPLEFTFGTTLSTIMRLISLMSGAIAATLIFGLSPLAPVAQINAVGIKSIVNCAPTPSDSESDEPPTPSPSPTVL